MTRRPDRRFLRPAWSHPADLAAFPHVKLTLDIRNDGVHLIDVRGDETTNFPNPADSVGFTANVEIDVINDTGHALTGLTFALTPDRAPIVTPLMWFLG